MIQHECLQLEAVLTTWSFPFKVSLRVSFFGSKWLLFLERYQLFKTTSEVHNLFMVFSVSILKKQRNPPFVVGWWECIYFLQPVSPDQLIAPWKSGNHSTPVFPVPNSPPRLFRESDPVDFLKEKITQLQFWRGRISLRIGRLQFFFEEIVLFFL